MTEEKIKINMKTRMKDPREHVQSVSRAIDVLEDIAFLVKKCCLTEIGDRLGLNRSAVHMLLATLVYRGYVRQEVGLHSCTSGFRLLEVGDVVKNSLDLEQTTDHLPDLMSRPDETIHLGILEEGEVVFRMR